MLNLYPEPLENWNLDSAKAPAVRSIAKRSVLMQYGPLCVARTPGLWRSRNSNLLTARGIAEGPCELNDIYTALKVEKSGVVSGYMEDLVTAGFVSHDFTWHLKTGKDSKLSHYRLKDNYLRFYLKYIEPNKKKIEKQGLKPLPQWQSAMGLQF